MPIVLTATAGTARFHYRFEQAEVLVGRGEAVDVRLPHPSVSMVHLCLRERRGRLLVMDSGSTNGTTLDGAPLSPEEPAPAPPGCRLSVGIFQLVINEAEQGETTAPADTAGFARRMVLEVLGDGDHPVLLVQNSPERGARLELPPDGEPRVVGRDAACDLRLSDADASRRHMEARNRDDLVQVRDLESKNGVGVDGAAISGWHDLDHGAKIKIGKTELLLVDPAAVYLEELNEASAEEAAQVEEPAVSGEEASSRAELRRLDMTLLGAAAALVAGAAALISYLAGWI